MSNDVVIADDGLPATRVGEWAKQKHLYLRRYLDISRGARAKFLGKGKAGATFVDLFSGYGRSQIRETDEWIEGSSVAAWSIGAAGGAPFSEMFVADVDPACCEAAATRLERVGAPVRELVGAAVSAARSFVDYVNPAGLHVAFLDPFDLGSLDFEIIKILSRLQRIDMLIHVSAMDLQRNWACTHRPT
jgi:three-Cys-motif partner protein